MGVILSADGVNFRNLLSYPTIRIQKGQTVFVCGESGSGKSTLLKLFNATVSAEKGQIQYCGRPVETFDTVALRKEVMLVSQTVFLFDGTIEECFQKYYEYREISPLSKEQMNKYLSVCCADFSLDEHCETMSGGERQRVFIAICLSFLPKVLMLDEPTSALDTITAQKLLENIKTFCKENKSTLIVVSHDENLTNTFADTKIVLKREDK